MSELPEKDKCKKRAKETSPTNPFTVDCCRPQFVPKRPQPVTSMGAGEIRLSGPDAAPTLSFVARVDSSSDYTVEDLDWLRAELGQAHLELDPWGSLIVTPATDVHEIAVARLHGQALRQLRLPDEFVLSNGLPWKVPGGSGYVNVPDLTVLAPGWSRVDDLHLDPPPTLIVEVGSPSTRRADRGRKLADYHRGGAAIYVLVDLPATPGAEVVFEAHNFATGEVITAAGAIDLEVGARPLRFDLT
jgi:Uma2 family endonuclease